LQKRKLISDTNAGRSARTSAKRSALLVKRRPTPRCGLLVGIGIPMCRLHGVSLVGKSWWPWPK